jgi:transposase-like protein
MITDKLRSYAAARAKMGLHLDHRQHKGLNNRAENSHGRFRVKWPGSSAHQKTPVAVSVSKV